ncbi:MAG: DUF4058 family protein, partial [Cyanobacteriota bacterium]|nr:DUF4058 family protein [Cyanobacteriota bacterium]
RSDRRPRAELYAFNLYDALPAFPLPLRSEDVEPQINLQQLLAALYDRAGYDYRINYDLDPVPPLAEAEASWAKERLQHSKFEIRNPK